MRLNWIDSNEQPVLFFYRLQHFYWFYFPFRFLFISLAFSSFLLYWFFLYFVFSVCLYVWVFLCIFTICFISLFIFIGFRYQWCATDKSNALQFAPGSFNIFNLNFLNWIRNFMQSDNKLFCGFTCNGRYAGCAVRDEFQCIGGICW